MNWLLGLGLLIAAFVFVGLRARSSWRRSVRQQVRELLRAQDPDAELVKETETTLELRFADGTTGTLGLSNLYTGLAMGPREPEAQQEAIRAFVSGALASLRESGQPLSLERHGERLLPRLAEPGFASDAAAQGKPLVHRETSVPGLVTLYVLDGAESVMYLGQERLQELGIDAEALHARALANLARRPIADVVRGVVEQRQLAMVKLGDSYDATRLLLVPGALQEGEELVAVVPDRETLGLMPVPSADAWGPVRKLARTPASPYRLLDRPLRVTREGFSVV
jgi:uncharacterized protein YtpQ (UPF0354 family)